eukprot:2391296-Prymnesium_polylepis.1
MALRAARRTLVRRAHADIEQLQRAAASRGDPRHDVVADGHPHRAIADRRQRRRQLFACRVLAQRRASRPRVAAEPERPRSRVEQVAAQRLQLGAQRGVERVDRAVALRQARAQPGVHEERPAACGAAHRDAVLRREPLAEGTARRVECGRPVHVAAERLQFVAVHVARAPLHVEQLVVADQQHELAAGGRRLVPEAPEELEQRQRGVPAVEHVAHLHDSHATAHPGAMRVDRAAKAQRAQRVLRVAVEVADAAERRLRQRPRRHAVGGDRYQLRLILCIFCSSARCCAQ